MVLARRNLTVDDKRLITVNYSQWLLPGTTLDTATATPDSDNAEVTDLQILADHIKFFVEAAVANETFTIEVQIVDSLTQIKNDSIEFSVIDP